MAKHKHPHYYEIIKVEYIDSPNKDNAEHKTKVTTNVGKCFDLMDARRLLHEKQASYVIEYLNGKSRIRYIL